MSYVDAYLDKENNKLLVSERINGQRLSNTLSPVYEFYIQDEIGEYMGPRHERLKKYTFNNAYEFYKEAKVQKELGHKLYESDQNVTFKTLGRNYEGSKPAKLHKCFFDIEVDYDADIGFPDPQKAELPITAITFYCNWLDNLITICLKPKDMSNEEAEQICSKFKNTILCKDETELLESMIQILDDSDVISGWNSSFFDLPYVINRIKNVMGKSRTKDLCLWEKFPVEREVFHFKRQRKYMIYMLVGKAHIDYLELYQKHSPKQQESYSLDYISEMEVGERKVEYEGTLDQLYNEDFEKFIEYNRQDTMLIKKLDDKLRYIELANQVAHTNSVTMDSTMGTVAWVDQAIINEAHSRNIIIPDKDRSKESEEDKKKKVGIAGAWVAEPALGRHFYVGCIDINSLYPSTIRSLNMSPETIFGQIRPTYTESHLWKKIEEGEIYKKKSEKIPDWGEAWSGLFNTLEVDMVWKKTDDMLTVDFESGETIEMTASELYNLIFNESEGTVCLSANGTLFRTDTKGIIPKLLEKWYEERVEMKKKMNNFRKEGKTDDANYWDLQQYVRKIQLNSLYGCLLQAGSKFYDSRMGQSTTLTGRCITRHMTSKVNELISGIYSEESGPIIAGDTDSVYFSADKYYREKNEEKNFTKDEILEMYEEIADKVNETFPGFMNERFNTGIERGSIIVGGLELVGTSALFTSKKHYGILKYFDDGFRVDKDGKPGKMKIKGLDILRADSPKVVRDFLKGVLMDILLGKTEQEIREKVSEFKKEFRELKPWEQGSPKSVKNLTSYERRLLKDATTNLPGHVRASMNWNTMCDVNNDKVSTRIADGTRIVVCKLKQNPYEMTSIAYPTDEHNLPKWFKALPFDEIGMKDSVLLKKLENIVSVLNWNLSLDEAHMKNFNKFFS